MFDFIWIPLGFIDLSGFRAIERGTARDTVALQGFVVARPVKLNSQAGIAIFKVTVALS